MGNPSESQGGRPPRRHAGSARPAPSRRDPRLRLAVLLAVLVLLGGALDSALGPSGRTFVADADRREVTPWQEARAQIAADSETVDETLRRTSYVSKGSGRAPNVALTFDDGPGAQTPEILAILDRFGADGTFFSLGSAVGEHPRQTRTELLAGSAVGNHTYAHPRLAMMPEAEQEREIDETTRALRREVPGTPRLFRPPYGSFDATTLELLERRRMLMVLWSIDATDFGGTDADTIADRVLAEVEPGSIVLMHDGGGDRTETVAALPKVLRGLERRGLSAVTVPELLRTNPPPRDQAPPATLDGMP